ncbi:MAG: BTAD domain-containing putative transcriptional regulator [Actinomycetota bacterium]|nr:BTAD domain-containing putative transcriptional regulator [Actinomycetota bacterium]
MGNLALKQDGFSGSQRNDSWFRPRKHLISRLLENRKALRIIVAPLYFGKTTLVRSYARQVFGEGEVTWVDGADPAFLCDIDGGSFGQDALEGVPASGLLVVEDLPYLDEIRKGVFMDTVRTLLERGVEVICTSVPSHDVLSSNVHDAVVLGPRDLLVRRQELADSPCPAAHDLFAVDSSNIEKARDLMLSRGRRGILQPARDMLPAMTWGIPSLVWGDPSYAAAECLRGFFDERLPREFSDVALSMVLLGSGSLQQLVDLGITVTGEAIDMLKTRYPLFGIDELKGTFDSIPVQVEDLVRFEMEMPASWQEGQGAVEGIVRMLLDRGSFGRALEVVDALLPAASASKLMIRHGAELLDNGLALQVSHVLDGICGPNDGDDPGLVYLRLWSMCLSGRRGDVHGKAAGADEVRDDPEMGMLLRLFALDERDDRQARTGGSMSQLGAGIPSGCPCVLECLQGDAGSCPLGTRQAGRRHMVRCAALQLIGILAGGRSLARGMLPQGLSGTLGRMMRDCPPALWRLAIHAALACMPQEVDDALLTAAIAGDGERSLTRAVLVEDAVILGKLPSRCAPNSVDDVQARSLLDPYFGIEGVFGMDASGEAMPFLHLFETLRLGRDARKGADAAPGTLPTLAHAPEATVIERGDPQLFLKLFGTFEVFDGGERIENPYIAKRQVREMLAYLVLGKGRELSREHLFCEMWPASDMVRARNSFYIVWGNMRRALSLDDGQRRFIDLRENTIALNRKLVGSDVFRFDELQRKLISSSTMSLDELIGVFSELERVYTGDLLGSGFESEYFEGTRERYRESFIDAMVSASRVAYAQDKEAVALWFARKSVEYGPDREDTYESLILAQLSNGQTISATRSYRRYRSILAEGYGVTPSDEVRCLFERVAPGMLQRLDEEIRLSRWQGKR